MNTQKEKRKLRIPAKPFQLNDETIKEYNDFIKNEDLNNGAHSSSTQIKKNLKVNVNSFHPSPEVIQECQTSFLNQLHLNDQSYPIKKIDWKKDRRSQFQKFFDHFQTEYESQQFEEKQNNQIEMKHIINTSQILSIQKSNAKQNNQQQKQIQENNKIIHIDTQQSKPIRKPLRNPFKKDNQVVIHQTDKIDESNLQIWQSSPHKQVGSQEYQREESVFPSKLIFSQFSPISEPNDQANQVNYFNSKKKSKNQQSMPKGKQKVKVRVQSSITVVQHKVQWTGCQGTSCQLLPKNEYQNLFKSLAKKPVTRQEIYNACLNLMKREVIPPSLNTIQIQQLTKFQVEFFSFQIYQWGMISYKLHDLRNNLVEQNYNLIIKLINILSDRNMCQVIDQDCLSDFNVFVQTEYVYAAFLILVIEMSSFGDTLIPLMITTLRRIMDNIQQAYYNQVNNYNEIAKQAKNSLNKQQVHKDLYQALQHLCQQSFQVFEMYDQCTRIQKQEDRVKFEKDFDWIVFTMACQHDEIVNELNKCQIHNKPQDQCDKYKEQRQNFKTNIQNQLIKYLQLNQNVVQKQVQEESKNDQIEEAQDNKVDDIPEKDDNSQDSQNVQEDENQDQNSFIMKVIQIDMDSIDDKVSQDSQKKVSIKQEQQKANENQKEMAQNQKKQVKGQNEIKTQQQRTDEAKQKKWQNIMKQKEIEAMAKQAKLDKQLKKLEIQQSSNLKQDTEKQNELKQEISLNICNQQGIDQPKDQDKTQQQNAPQELSKRQQKKLAKQKAQLEKQLQEQQQKEQFEKERQPQPYTVDKMQDILKNTKYDGDAFNSPQWTKLLKREPIVEIIQKQKLRNYKNKNVQSKQKYHFKDILRKKSLREEIIKYENGQLRIIRYEYSLTEVQKLNEFKVSMRWYHTYITNLTPTTVQIQEITLFLNKIHPFNIEKLFQETLKYIAQKQYQLGNFVDLLMKRMIYDSIFRDQYILLALKLKDKIKLKDQQQGIILNKSYILLLQQTLSKQFEIFLNQENIQSYFQNCIKIVESFWNVEIIGEQYVSELLLQILWKIEQEGKEYQIIMLVKLLNRVFNKYKKFVDHFYLEVHPQSIQLQSKISLLTLKEITDKMIKCIPMQGISSRCKILVENIYEYNCGNSKCIIAEDIQFYKSYKEQQREKIAQIQQIKQQIQDDEYNCEIQLKVRDSFQLDYEEQYYALEELLVCNQSYVSQTHIFKELFYQIFEQGQNEIKNSLIIYKLVIHRKTLLISVQKGSYQALELLKNKDLYHPEHLYDIWKGILKPFLDKLQSYELSHVCLLIDPSNSEQDYYFQNLTLDLIMDFTKNGRRNPQDKIKILLDYKEQYSSHKKLFDMTESFYLSGKVKLEEDFQLQAKLYQRILISIFQSQFIKSSQLIDLMRNTQNFLIGAFKMASGWAFDYIARLRIEEFAEILYNLLYNLANNDLFEIVSIIGLDREYYFILDKLIKNLPDKRRQLIACL